MSGNEDASRRLSAMLGIGGGGGAGAASSEPAATGSAASPAAKPSMSASSSSVDLSALFPGLSSGPGAVAASSAPAGGAGGSVAAASNALAAGNGTDASTIESMLKGALKLGSDGDGDATGRSGASKGAADAADAAAAASSSEPGTKLSPTKSVYSSDPGSAKTLKNLESSPITLLPSDYMYQIGRLISVSDVYICYAVRSGMIRVINQQTAVRTLLKSHLEPVVDLAFMSSKHNTLASVSKDGSLIMWQLSGDGASISAEIVLRLQLPNATPGKRLHYHRVAWHPQADGRFATLGFLPDGTGHEAVLWDLAALQATAKDGVVVTGSDETMSRSEAVALRGHGQPINDISYDPNAPRVLTACRDGTVRVWNSQTGACLRSFTAHDTQPVYSVNFVAGAGPSAGMGSRRAAVQSLILTGGARNSDIKLWSLPSTLSGKVEDDDWTPDLLHHLQFHHAKEKMFYNHVAIDPSASFIVMANTKQQLIYVIHLNAEEGRAAHLDYLVQYSVSQPVLSFCVTNEPRAPDTTPTNDVPLEMQVYCVQTKVIQQHHLSSAAVYPLAHVPASRGAPATAAAAMSNVTAGASGKVEFASSAHPAATAAAAPADGKDSGSSNSSSGGDGGGGKDDADSSKEGLLHPSALMPPSALTAASPPPPPPAAMLDSPSDSPARKHAGSPKPVSSPSRRNSKSKHKSSANAAANDASTPSGKASKQADTSKDAIPTATTTTSSSVPAPSPSSKKERAAAAARAKSLPIGAVASADSGPISDPDLQRLEANVMLRIEKLFQQYTDRQYARLEKERAEREKAERERQARLLETVSATLQANLSALLDAAVHREMQSTIVPAIGKVIIHTMENSVVQPIQTSFRSVLSDSLVPRIEQVVREKMSVAGAAGAGAASPADAQAIAAAVATKLHQPIQQSFRSSFEASIIPSFEAGVKEMFAQVHRALEQGLAHHQAGSSHAAAVGGGAPSGHGQSPIQLADQGQYDQAFLAALSALSLPVVLQLCEHVGVDRIFDVHPCPLSQMTLLTLVQQLAAYGLDDNAALKLDWLHHCALMLNPQQTPEGPAIVQGVIDKLQAAVPVFSTPGHPLSKQFRTTLHIFNSIIH